jgi:trigger factor
MDITVTPKTETSQVELKIAATADDLKPYLEKAAQKLSSDSPLKGFRPGKAPLKMAVEAYGTDRVLNEAITKAIPHFFVEAVMAKNIEALGRPVTAIEAAGLSEGLRFTATVDVLPNVTLGDPKTLQIEKRAVTVTDEDLNKELTYLAKSRSTFLEVARAAQKGDTVTVDFVVSQNGSPLAGGESKNHPVHVGEGHFVPEFEDKLVGIRAGEEREFTITFPDDFGNKELRGQKAEARVKAHSVQQRMIPEINDDFAKRLGKFTDLNNLKEELKKNLQNEREQHERERWQGELVKQLAEKSTFGTIPAILIEREVESRLAEFEQMLALQRRTLEEYLVQHDRTIQQVQEEMRAAAEESVRASLALREFAQEQKITIPDEAVEERMKEYLTRYASLKKAESDIDTEELRTRITSTLRNQQAIESLASLAQVTEAKK